MSLERAQTIIDEEFEKAAARATQRLQPIVDKAVAKVRKYLPLRGAGEGMGMTIIVLGPPFEGVHQGSDLQRSEYEDLNVPAAAAEAYDELYELLAMLGEYRAQFQLYETIGKPFND